MDHAYVWNIKDWLEKFDDNKDYIRKAHMRIHEISKLMPKRRVKV